MAEGQLLSRVGTLNDETDTWVEIPAGSAVILSENGLDAAEFKPEVETHRVDRPTGQRWRRPDPQASVDDAEFAAQLARQRCADCAVGSGEIIAELRIAELATGSTVTHFRLAK